MKFNCGMTAQERYHEKWLKQKAEQERIQKWHTVFAWWPTRVGPGDCRWLETIEAKATLHEDWYFGGSWFTWEYRPLNKLDSLTLE